MHRDTLGTPAREILGTPTVNCGPFFLSVAATEELQNNAPVVRSY